MPRSHFLSLTHTLSPSAERVSASSLLLSYTSPENESPYHDRNKLGSREEKKRRSKDKTGGERFVSRKLGFLS